MYAVLIYNIHVYAVITTLSVYIWSEIMYGFGAVYCPCIYGLKSCTDLELYTGIWFEIMYGFGTHWSVRNVKGKLIS